MCSTCAYVAIHVLSQSFCVLTRQLLLLGALVIYYGLLMWQQPSRFRVITNLEGLTGLGNILGLLALLVALHSSDIDDSS